MKESDRSIQEIVRSYIELEWLSSFTENCNVDVYRKHIDNSRSCFYVFDWFDLSYVFKNDILTSNRMLLKMNREAYMHCAPADVERYTLRSIDPNYTTFLIPNYESDLLISQVSMHFKNALCWNIRDITFRDQIKRALDITTHDRIMRILNPPTYQERLQTHVPFYHDWQHKC